MQLNSKKLLAAGAVLSLLLPVVTYATTLTSDQVNSVISLLQSYGADSGVVSKVGRILTGASEGDDLGSPKATTTTWGKPPMPPGQFGKTVCITLLRDLKQGSQGDDVKKLQDLLAQDPQAGFNASSTGFFGSLTAKALIRFQMAHGIATSTAGIAGPLTRGFFERSCGKGLLKVGGENGQGHKPSLPPTAGSSTSQ